MQAKDAYLEMVRKIEALEEDSSNASATLAAALATLPPVQAQSLHPSQAL